MMRHPAFEVNAIDRLLKPVEGWLANPDRAHDRV